MEVGYKKVDGKIVPVDPELVPKVKPSTKPNPWRSTKKKPKKKTKKRKRKYNKRLSKKYGKSFYTSEDWRRVRYEVLRREKPSAYVADGHRRIMV